MSETALMLWRQGRGLRRHVPPAGVRPYVPPGGMQRYVAPSTGMQRFTAPSVDTRLYAPSFMDIPPSVPLAVEIPTAVIPDADPIFNDDCLRRILEAYLEGRYWAQVETVMFPDANTPPPQPKADYCSNFGLVLAEWEKANNKEPVEDRGEFMRRVAEFKAWSPFASMTTPGAQVLTE